MKESRNMDEGQRMNHDQLTMLINALVNGDITPDEHQALESALKNDAQARALFRERMDLEAGLRTWASETPLHNGAPTNSAVAEPAARGTVPAWQHAAYFAVGAAAALLLLALVGSWSGWWETRREPMVVERAAETSEPKTSLVEQASPTSAIVGFVQQQRDCEWTASSFLSASRFGPGKYLLAKGVAQFSFESGTDVILEGPCELEVLARDSAKLVSGNVFVRVNELSNGFTLETPEARVIDEGTEYAVSIQDASTEVHVFDGSVIWQPHLTNAEVTAPDKEERIEAGEAKQYAREQPMAARAIPFGGRAFVRQLEADVKEQSGAALLAYEGFENLGGPLRRDRSGFGWANAWAPATKIRGRVSDVVDAPSGLVFGADRTGRRLLAVSKGDNVRRSLEKPLPMQPGNSYFISFLVTRLPNENEAHRSLQVSLDSHPAGHRHRRHQIVSFGLTSRSFPFINCADAVSETASPIADGEVCLCVARLVVGNQTIHPALRVYRPSEQIDATEPLAWTVTGAIGAARRPVESIRLSAGKNAAWQVDELKVGTTWQSVTSLVPTP